MLRFLFILISLAAASAAAAQERPAKELFGAVSLPDNLASEPIGFYSRGCMAGGAQLVPDGPNWQAMRLSRNRQWGLPILVNFLEGLAHDAAAQDGWPGLLVGDMSQPRGGPMLTGHASHQVGLDADIWLTPMPAHRLSEREREDISAVPLTEPGPHEVYPQRWTAAHGRVIRRAALDPRVERIFVAPGIKRQLCRMPEADASWLRKVRPYYGHNYHFHVRLSCPAGTNCRAQSPPPPGDGCGADLDYWFTKAPYAQAEPETPAKPPKEIMLDELPAACRKVLQAEPRPGVATMREAFRMGASGASPAAVAADIMSTPAVSAATFAEPARLPKPRPAGF